MVAIIFAVAAVVATVGWRRYRSDALEAQIDRLLREPSDGHYGNYELNSAAAEELRTVGTNAVLYLIRALDRNCYDASADQLLMINRRFGWISEERLPLPHWEFCQHIASAFGELDGASRDIAVPLLASRIKDPKRARLAGHALAAMGRRAKSAVPELIAAFHSTNEVIMNAAAGALGCVDPETFNKLTKASK